jgi:glycerophosphoryl diester phosphodiesterase
MQTTPPSESDRSQLEATLAARGFGVPETPLILGHRGAPRLAPENTLASLARALELGLDGVEYDLQASASGEPVLLHDDTLDRTTDGHGPAEAASLAELSSLDAGAWFSKAFAGEPLPMLEEALALDASARGAAPLHMIELKRADLVASVARALAELPRPLPVRIASFHREVCVEAQALGLPSMLLGLRASEEDRAFVRRERLAAYGVAAFGWRTPAGAADWPCERWAWTVDQPADLLEACRRPLFGFNTNEPLRALSVRALCHHAPHDSGPYPLEVPELELELGSQGPGAGGQWAGRWTFAAAVRNPFGFEVEVELSFRSGRGAFEIAAENTRARLAPGERAAFPLRLTGGSWSPGGDPLLLVEFVPKSAAGAPFQRLILDAPLERVRHLRLREDTQRLALLEESPGQAPASILVRRRGRELLARIEQDGGLVDARLWLHLDGETHGGQGPSARLALPADWAVRPGGLRFSAALEGRERLGPRRVWRRYAGGLPADLLSGVPGRLLPG